MTKLTPSPNFVFLEKNFDNKKIFGEQAKMFRPVLLCHGPIDFVAVAFCERQRRPFPTRFYYVCFHREKKFKGHCFPAPPSSAMPLVKQNSLKKPPPRAAVSAVYSRSTRAFVIGARDTVKFSRLLVMFTHSLLIDLLARYSLTGGKTHCRA